MREPRKRSQSGRVISIDSDAYHLGDFDRSDLAFWLKQIESVGEMSGCLVVESMMEMQSRVRQTLTWIYRRGCCPLTLASSLRDCGGFNIWLSTAKKWTKRQHVLGLLRQEDKKYISTAGNRTCPI